MNTLEKILNTTGKIGISLALLATTAYTTPAYSAEAKIQDNGNTSQTEKKAFKYIPAKYGCSKVIDYGFSKKGKKIQVVFSEDKQRVAILRDGKITEEMSIKEDGKIYSHIKKTNISLEEHMWDWHLNRDKKLLENKRVMELNPIQLYEVAGDISGLVKVIDYGKSKTGESYKVRFSENGKKANILKNGKKIYYPDIDIVTPLIYEEIGCTAEGAMPGESISPDFIIKKKRVLYVTPKELKDILKGVKCNKSLNKHLNKKEIDSFLKPSLEGKRLIKVLDYGKSKNSDKNYFILGIDKKTALMISDGYIWNYPMKIKEVYGFKFKPGNVFKKGAEIHMDALIKLVSEDEDLVKNKEVLYYKYKDKKK